MKKKTKAEELVAPERPHLSPSAEFGLTQAQVEAQKDAGLINTAVHRRTVQCQKCLHDRQGESVHIL